MKSLILGTLLLTPVMIFAQATTTPLVGGDRDALGCIPSAGYVWDAILNKCVRPWEQKATSTINVACVQAAVEKRENALIAGHDTFNTSIKAALEARKVALKDAWSAADKATRQSKKNTAYKNFKTSTQSAHTSLRGVRNTAWSAFTTEMKACGVKDHGERSQSVAVPATSL